MQVDAGVADELVLGDPKAPRYVFWEKKLRPTPSGPDILTFDLLTLLGKIRAGLGAIGLKEKAPGALPTHLPHSHILLATSNLCKQAIFLVGKL